MNQTLTDSTTGPRSGIRVPRGLFLKRDSKNSDILHSYEQKEKEVLTSRKPH